MTAALAERPSWPARLDLLAMANRVLEVRDANGPVEVAEWFAVRARERYRVALYADAARVSGVAA